MTSVELICCDDPVSGNVLHYRNYVVSAGTLETIERLFRPPMARLTLRQRLAMFLWNGRWPSK